MEIINISIQRMKKDPMVEFIHSFCDKAETVETVTQTLGEWFAPFKASVDEMMRVYYITLVSPLTEERTLVDSQRDGIITGLKALTNSYLKSTDAETLAAAKTVNVGLKGVHLNNNDQYIAQTAQIDNLLHYLMEEHPEAVEKLGLTSQVQQLKALNDRMHAIIEERVAEREGKVFGAFEFARTQVETCYRDLIKGINSWAFINSAKLTDEAEDLARFISWANATIEVYKQKVLHTPVGTPEAGNEEKDPDDPTEPPVAEKPDGEPVDPTTPPTTDPTTPPTTNPTDKPDEDEDETEYTATFYYHDDTEDSRTGVVGSPLKAPKTDTGYRWEPTPPSVMPAEDTSYHEVPDNA